MYFLGPKVNRIVVISMKIGSFGGFYGRIVVLILSLIKSNKLKINGPKRRVFECVLVNKEFNYGDKEVTRLGQSIPGPEQWDAK